MLFIDTNKTEKRFIECCDEHKDVSIIYKDNEEIGYLQGVPNNNGFLINILEFKKEYRYKGWGTKLVNNILTIFDYVYCPVTDEKSLRFWRKFKPKEYNFILDFGYEFSRKDNEMKKPLMLFIGKNTEQLENYLKSIKAI